MTSRLVLLVFTLGVLLGAGCRHSSQHAASGEGGSPKPVVVVTVGPSPGLGHVAQMGSVVARHHADIETKVQARVERIPVALGTRVRRGDLLAELDTRELRARVEQASALLGQAAQDLARFEMLLAQSAATQQEYDGIKARKTIAAAALTEAEAMLSYAQITAPFSGTVTRKDINVGDLAVPGRPLFAVEDETALQFVVAIPEARRRRIMPGDTLPVEIPSAETLIPGVLEELSPSADPLSRTFIAKLGLPARPELRVGQFGRLLIPTEEEASVSIPPSALVRRGQLEIVYVVTDDNRVALRLVRTGRQMPDVIEVLAGLSEGERVVVSSQVGLSDGDRVEVQS